METNEMTVQQAISELVKLGFKDCMNDPSKQHFLIYSPLYAFEYPDDRMVYCCYSDADVFELLEVESSVFPELAVENVRSWCPRCQEMREDPESKRRCACGSALIW